MTPKQRYYPIYAETGGFDYPAKLSEGRIPKGTVMAVVETALPVRLRGLEIPIADTGSDGEPRGRVTYLTFAELKAGAPAAARIVW